MRVWMILLLLVTTSAALGVGIWYMSNRNQVEVDPAIELPEPDELVQVYYGSTDDLEILLRPYYGDTVEDQFHDEQLGRMLDLEDEHSYGRLWLVNHADKALPFDTKKDSVVTLVRDGGETAATVSLLTLVEKSGGIEKLKPSDAMILRALGSFDRRSLEGSEFLDLTVALPFRLGSRPLQEVRSKRHHVTLTVASARREDLRTYGSVPQGRMSELLIRSSDQVNEKEQASRK